MYHRPAAVKAAPPRSVARSPKPAKAAAEPRPAATTLPSRERKAAPGPGAKQRTAPAAPERGLVAASKRAAPTKPAAAAEPSVKRPRSRLAAATSALTASKGSKGSKDSPKQPLGDSSEPPKAKKAPRKSIKEAAGVSTDAVARRTGKSWDDWFEVLDSAGAATLDQRGIIAILAQKHGIGPWWQQMIAVGYESLRSKSDKPPSSDGFHIASSCTLDAPLPRVFRLWNDSSERARWLADDRFVVRATKADKVIRARWGKGTSHVAVSFAERAGRTEVSVEHHQIESRSAAEQMKAYWEKKLGLLDRALSPGR
jgi:hypothetical protein